jgi:hypothetical protein
MSVAYCARLEFDMIMGNELVIIYPGDQCSFCCKRCGELGVVVYTHTPRTNSPRQRYKLHTACNNIYQAAVFERAGVMRATRMLTAIACWMGHMPRDAMGVIVDMWLSMPLLPDSLVLRSLFGRA